MIFYIINLLLLSLCMYTTRKNKKVMFRITFIWLVMVAACRGVNVGADYDAYERFFKIYSEWGWIESLNWGQEIGYVWLNKIIALLGGNYQTLLAICAILAMIGVISFIKRNSSHPILSVWMYIAIIFYQCTFTRLRQAIAISFVLISYEYAKQHNFKRFLIFIFIAVCFHQTAIIALLIYPFINKRISQKSIIILFASLGVIILGRSYVNSILSFIVNLTSYNRYEFYGSGEGEVLLILYVIIILFIFFGAYYRYRFKEKLNEKEIIILNLFNFSIFAIWFQALASYISLINRAAEYFSIPMILLLPNIIDSFESRDRKLIMCVMWGMSLALYIYMLNQGASQTVPYTTFWSN